MKYFFGNSYYLSLGMGEIKENNVHSLLSIKYYIIIFKQRRNK